MSRLHDPGPGEILDRLTILALKITHGRLKGIDTKHWEVEQGALITSMRGVTAVDESAEATRALVLLEFEIAAVNGALWQAEDDLRRLSHREEDLGPRGTELSCKIAFRIQQLNDRRAELVTLINANFGREGTDKIL